jgi:hypothetical protein
VDDDVLDDGAVERIDVRAAGGARVARPEAHLHGMHDTLTGRGDVRG